MRIIFMGTPEFAVPSFINIQNSNHEIVAIVTGMDKKRGRGQQVTETPVKQAAKSFDIPIIQPESLKSEEFIETLSSFNADIFVVVAFRILPRSVIGIPKFGTVNLHSSLLPKYRGAAPINWALINGDKETGVTIFQIEPKVDTGDILLQQSLTIDPLDTCKELHDKLSLIGAETLVKAIDGFEIGNLKKSKQNNTLATKAPKIFPEMGEINWDDNAEKIKNLIHGFSPFPGAFTNFNNKRLKILRAEYIDDSTNQPTGTILIKEKNRLGIQTGNGTLFPLEMQKAGKKMLRIKEFLNGFQGNVGDKFIS